jgi:hypothetical protein
VQLHVVTVQPATHPLKNAGATVRVST